MKVNTKIERKNRNKQQITQIRMLIEKKNRLIIYFMSQFLKLVYSTSPMIQ